MELAIAVTLSFLEVTFITSGLLLLHALRNQIGKTPFYLALGALFIYLQLISAAELKVVTGVSGLDFSIGSTVLFLPLLGCVMLVYITEGTLATQRLIIGAVCTFALYIYISYITTIQCSWSGFSISQGPTSDSLQFLIEYSLRMMMGSVTALVIDLFILPIFFQRLRNLGWGIFLSVFLALALTQIVDAFIFVSVTFWGDQQLWSQITSSYIARFAVSLWIGFLITVYLKRIERDIPGKGKGSLDIVFAFLGSYGREKALQKDLSEWEGRYRMVIENASDMIFIVDRKGRILDANPPVVRFMKPVNPIGSSFVSLVDTFSILPCLWNKLCEQADSTEGNSDSFLTNKQLKLTLENKKIVELDAAFSKTYIRGNQVFIVVCRNITERNRLLKEKEELTEQLYHAQRIESLGKLAGGVSHEFNNILHAIQGNVDLVLMFDKKLSESTQKHLQNIMSMVDKAGVITAQLLGFARKNRYNETKLDLRKVLKDTEDMFRPLAKKLVIFSLNLPNYSCYVKGDPIQLQQVFLNLLINAMDAVNLTGKDDKIIIVTLSLGKFFPDDWRPRNVEANVKDYYEITFKDNGIGMNEETISRIFEPFYTTKEIGKGTGMGLAMVYGEVTGHSGFIHVKSRLSEGSIFYIYLPILKS